MSISLRFRNCTHFGPCLSVLPELHRLILFFCWKLGVFMLNCPQQPLLLSTQGQGIECRQTSYTTGRPHTWCLRRSTRSSPLAIPGGFGCSGKFKMSSVEHKVSRSEVRRLSSLTFSRLESICLSSAARVNSSCCFLKASAASEEGM
jgi:hypothetical protein